MSPKDFETNFENKKEFRCTEKRNYFIEECYNNPEISEYAYTDPNSEGISFVYFNLNK